MAKMQMSERYWTALQFLMWREDACAESIQRVVDVHDHDWYGGTDLNGNHVGWLMDRIAGDDGDGAYEFWQRHGGQRFCNVFCSCGAWNGDRRNGWVDGFCFCRVHGAHCVVLLPKFFTEAVQQDIRQRVMAYWTRHHQKPDSSGWKQKLARRLAREDEDA